MRKVKKKFDKKKQLFYSLLGLFGLLVVLFGTTYAIFTYSKEGTTENLITAGTINLSYLTDTGNNVGISLTEAYPVSDSVAMVSTNPDNIFDFTLSGQNDGNTDIPFEVTLEKTDISDLPEDVVKIYLTDITESDEIEILEPALYSDLYTSVFKKENVVEEKVIYQGKIEANTTYNKTLRLRMWVSEDIDFDSGDYDELTFDTIVNIYSDSTTSITNICTVEEGFVWNFDYTGTEQEFTVPCNGTYKLETWGAQGGYAFNSNYFGGYGGYAIGKSTLNIDSLLYINVGGKGIDALTTNIDKDGGYNGGGYSTHFKNNDCFNGSGGGATHVAFQSGQLYTFENNISNLLIVSGAGGGSGIDNSSNLPGYSFGGSGGGFNGVDSYNITGSLNSSYGYGGTQNSGGSFYASQFNGSTASFGRGADSISNGTSGGSGGGGGFYGGGSSGGHFGAGGGSGYIGNTNLTNKVMYCYNCTESNEEATKTISTTCTSATPTANCAKQGNGYARITYLGNN